MVNMAVMVNVLLSLSPREESTHTEAQLFLRKSTDLVMHCHLHNHSLGTDFPVLYLTMVNILCHSLSFCVSNVTFIQIVINENQTTYNPYL